MALGKRASLSNTPSEKEWIDLFLILKKHAMAGTAFCALDKLNGEGQKPPLGLLYEWIGLITQDETRYDIQQEAAYKMAHLFHKNYIRTYVLKGIVVAECYPQPKHRLSADMDCFLLPEKGNFDAWSLGNDLITANGYETKIEYYKDSSFCLPGLIVENHRYLTPFRGNKRLKQLEILLQNMLRKDKGEDIFEGTWLYRPPVMVTALFLIEHAYSHFLHEGLTWRHILDWMLFSDKHKHEINWLTLEGLIDEYGFRRFYNSYYHLGQYLIGKLSEDDLTTLDKKMLSDVWAELDVHETLHGIKGKLALVGNTWRARWKYHYFSEISMLQALWIQVKGFLFIKEPKLS